jgi:hypothetical protein
MDPNMIYDSKDGGKEESYRLLKRSENSVKLQLEKQIAVEILNDEDAKGMPKEEYNPERNLR